MRLTDGRESTAQAAKPSILGGDLSLNGNLISTGDLEIDGHVQGNIRGVSVTVGATAIVQGDILAETVTVQGVVRGSIVCRKIWLTSTCRVEGTIAQETIAIEIGARFEGSCRRLDKSNAARLALEEPGAVLKTVA